MTSYCAVCGGQLSEGANFCSGCGKAVQFQPSSAPIPGRPLFRVKAGRKLGGVCVGLAQQYSWDISYVRLFVILFTVLTIPIGLAAYAICWVVIPEVPTTVPVAVPGMTGLNPTP